MNVNVETYLYICCPIFLLLFKYHFVDSCTDTVENRMTILGKARLTGQKESQACLRFPESECVCVSVCAHLSTGLHCLS